MRTITLEEYHNELKAQKVPRDHLAVKCPVCGTIQSAFDLIAAGAGKDFEEVEKYLAFSCVGRWTKAGPFHRKGGKKSVPQTGCDWTLGGLFRLHNLEVITPDGKKHMRFECCTPEEAQQHRKDNEQSNNSDRRIGTHPEHA